MTSHLAPDKHILHDPTQMIQTLWEQLCLLSETHISGYGTVILSIWNMDWLPDAVYWEKKHNPGGRNWNKELNHLEKSLERFAHWVKEMNEELLGTRRRVLTLGRIRAQSGQFNEDPRETDTLFSPEIFRVEWKGRVWWKDSGILVVVVVVLSRLLCVAWGILVPKSGIEPVPPSLRVQSLNHWTTREVPEIQAFLMSVAWWNRAYVRSPESVVPELNHG